MAKRKTSISGVSKNLSDSISEARDDEARESNLVLLDKGIGVSVSDSDELEELGYSKLHQKDITLEITRYLLVNGAHLVYGGDLRNGGFTFAFRDLAFQYRRQNSEEKMHYSNFFSWPIYLKLENSAEATFKRCRVKVVKVSPPEEIPQEVAKIFVEADSPENSYYWAKSMTKMRDEMTNASHARICIGGKLYGYKGFYPGIIEESYLSIKKKQPIYLFGAFGGATSILIRALKGENTNKLLGELIERNPNIAELEKILDTKSDKQVRLRNVLKEFANVGLKGLTKLNKLNADQNEILFTTRHFHEMIFYMVLGLKRAVGKK